MSRSHLVAEGTLTLPVGVLQTLHYGGNADVRKYRNIRTGSVEVGKRVSLAGREDTLIVQEATLLRAIEHDNVADVYDVHEVTGSDPALGVCEIMMPYYELGSVFDALVKRGDRFGVGSARDLAVRALRGISHLHERHRILHRDIKPANLFLSNDAHLVKVGDLGEAMAMDATRSADGLLVPRWWTPPETFVGMRYTVASEIYSMGITLHEMLCGPIPYDEYSIDQLSARLADGRSAVAPKHLRFPPHVPEPLRRVLRKATRRDPGGRYRTAGQMIDALLRARFIDWSWPTENGDGSKEWTGTRHGHDYRVQVKSVRGAGWRARGERRYASGWRRVSRCEFDAEGADQAAEAAFRHLSSVRART